MKVALKEIIADILRPCEASLNFDEHKPLVIMMCGVNGAGKTTTIGKLAKHLPKLNKKVLSWQPQIRLEAAAKEQLAVWGDRNQIEVISQEKEIPLLWLTTPFLPVVKKAWIS